MRRVGCRTVEGSGASPGAVSDVIRDPACDSSGPAWSRGWPLAIIRRFGPRQGGDQGQPDRALRGPRPRPEARHPAHGRAPRHSRETSRARRGRPTAADRLRAPVVPARQARASLSSSSRRRTGTRAATDARGLAAGDHPVWSPDGKWIAFRTHADQDGRGPTAADADPSRRERPADHQDARDNVLSSSFSPDGTWITFAAPGVGHTYDVWASRIDGTNMHPITRTKTWDSAPDWVVAR